MRRNNVLAITIIEVGNSEAPNVGTITGRNEEELNRKFIVALMRHFDANIESFSIQDGLNLMDVENSNPLDVGVVIDGVGYQIEISETWID